MMKHLSAIVVVLVLFGCESRETRLQSFLLKGNEQVSKGDDEKALYYFTEALKIDSCYVDALNNIGTVHHKTKRYSEAIDFYTKALICNGGYLPAFFNRANSYYESGQYRAAQIDVTAIITLKPDTAAAWFMQGLIQTKTRNYEGAEEGFQNALEHHATNELDCRVNLASVWMLMKKYDAARAELETCLKLTDKEPNIYNSLALIAIEKNDFNEAIKQANKGLELAPREPYLLNNRGFAYLELGKFSEAQADINESIILDPYNSWAYRNKGLLELKKKNFDEAERLLRKAKEMDPETERVDEYLSEIPKKSK